MSRQKGPIMTTNEFNAKTATKVEITRKLKALASQKTHAKQKGDVAKYEKVSAEYTEIAAIKAKRFPTKRSHSYSTYTAKEINALDLETTIKGVKSLQSLICVYPHRMDELAPVRDAFIAHRDTLQAQLKLAELQAQLNL